MNIISAKDYQGISLKACEFIIQTIKELDRPVLGLATGSTPEGLYQCLINRNKENQVSFQDVTTFNLDEYVGLTANHPNSYRYYMNEKLFQHIDITIENTYIPNGSAEDLEKECVAYEELIQQHDSIDLQILGIGHNGHIGFNEPGTPFTTRTHIVELAETTRKANARFFNSWEEVPSQAITTGIGTIMDSKQILLLVSGEDKAEALYRLLHGEITEQFPASVLKDHPNVTVIADEAALSKVYQ
ncbi:glucosamine-6-phosphate deaminase [Ornithinibacillus sp. FSL M8-0202]|uniref:glucosamine-6-phosphate deaminase n=1 Tax=unclassified Ornithinibacillus TaxID=2620869 RepID=UPI0030CF05C6